MPKATFGPKGLLFFCFGREISEQRHTRYVDTFALSQSWATVFFQIGFERFNFFASAFAKFGKSFIKGEIFSSACTQFYSTERNRTRGRELEMSERQLGEVNIKATQMRGK